MMERLKFKYNNTLQIRGVNYTDEQSNDEVSDDDEEQLFRRFDRNGRSPFCIEGTMCENYFEASIDTGSPVSIFTKRDLPKIIGEKKVVIRNMIDRERYVDYNKSPLKFLVYQFERLKMSPV